LNKILSEGRMMKKYKTHRRDFLKLSAASTMALSVPALRSRRVNAQSEPLLFISFEANGAWDPTCSFDPKGANVHSSHYDENHILTLPTGLTYAPKEVINDVPVPYMVGAESSKEDFFSKYQNDLLVIRGLDTQTNSHQIGPRHVFSGNLRAGNPSFAAMLGAIHEDTIGNALPMTFLSTGGFDNTENLLPPARVGNVNAFKDLSLPNRMYPRNTNTSVYFPESVEQLIKSKQNERTARLLSQPAPPKITSAIERLDRARSTEPLFPSLVDQISQFPALSAEESANPIIPEVQLVLAAMAGGQCVSANIAYGSFDTHQNHDALHRPRLQTFLDGIDYCHRMLTYLGLTNRAVILIGSDFSRTTYNDTDDTNDGRGKDHWPITGLLAMGPGIPGGRVIGETDDGDNGDGTWAKGFRAKKIKLVNGEIVFAEDSDPEADYLKPPDIHRALRALWGVENHALSDKFQVGESIFPLLPLFS
jgi:hypothetical protein